MILENASLVDDQHSPLLLPETAPAVTLLTIEPGDAFSDVLEQLRQQKQPVFLLLPISRETFSYAGHLFALRSLLAEKEHPPFLCLIIPAQHTRTSALAAHYGIEQASSLEAATQALTRFSQEDDLFTAHPLSTRRAARITEALPALNSPSSEHHPSMTNRQPFLLRAGLVLALLLLVSAIVVPLLLLPTHPPASQAGTTPLPGNADFSSSGQFDPSTTHGYNDLLTLSLRSLPAPPTGRIYDVWLLPDPGDDITPALLLGTLPHAGPVTMQYASPDHTNLLASYSGVRLTVQPEGASPELPGLHPANEPFGGSIPNTPTPGDEKQYSLLSHLRHLLAADPTLQADQIPGGLAIWLTRNLSKIEEWASAAQGDWHGTQSDTRQIHDHMLRLLDYLDGASYAANDVPLGSPWLVDPQAGKIGLLNNVANQDPPGFLAHVDRHLIALAQAPGHSSQQQQLALLVDTVITRMRDDLFLVRADAIQLVHKPAQQLQQPEIDTTLNTMAMLTTEVKSGWFDPATGESVGGVLWLMARLQQLTAIQIYPM